MTMMGTAGLAGGGAFATVEHVVRRPGQPHVPSVCSVDLDDDDGDDDEVKAGGPGREGYASTGEVSLLPTAAAAIARDPALHPWIIFRRVHGSRGVGTRRFNRPHPVVAVRFISLLAHNVCNW